MVHKGQIINYILPWPSSLIHTDHHTKNNGQKCLQCMWMETNEKRVPYMLRDQRSTTPSASQEAIHGPVSSNDSVAWGWNTIEPTRSLWPATIMIKILLFDSIHGVTRITWTCYVWWMAVQICKFQFFQNWLYFKYSGTSPLEQLYSGETNFGPEKLKWSYNLSSYYL